MSAERDSDVIIFGARFDVLQIQGVFPSIIGSEFQIEGVIINQGASAFVARVGIEWMTPLIALAGRVAPGARYAIQMAVSNSPTFRRGEESGLENAFAIKRKVGAGQRARMTHVLLVIFIVVTPLVFDRMFGPIQLRIRAHKLEGR